MPGFLVVEEGRWRARPVLVYMLPRTTAAATLLLALRGALTRSLEAGVEDAVTLSLPEDVAAFVRAELGANARECLLHLCLNDRNRLVRHATVIEGTVALLSPRAPEDRLRRQCYGAHPRA